MEFNFFEARAFLQKSVFDLNLRPPYDREEMIACIKKSAKEAFMVKVNEEELELVSEWILTSKY